MSYTHQKVAWEARQPQNVYGDFSYASSQLITARKERKQAIVKTVEGRELLSRTTYYVSPTEESNALLIEEMDKLDGELIVSRYQMCSLKGTVKLIRFITV